MRSLILLLIAISSFCLVQQANAAVIETSLMASYGRANFSDSYSYMERRYSGSIEFKFTAVSGIQFEYTDSYSRSTYDTTVGSLLPTTTKETTSYRDKVYSFNFVQNLVPAKWLIQPYFKVGGGRLDRVYAQEIPEFHIKQVITQRQNTGVGGLGLRIFLLRNLALKGEFNTYVPDFRFSKWKDNEQFSAGISWLF